MPTSPSIVETKSQVSSKNLALANLVVPKIAYFCYFAAMASFMPFLTLYYAQLGLTGREIGLLVGITPVVTLVAAPLWGALADATRQHKRLLLWAVIGSLVLIAFFLQATTIAVLAPIAIAYAFCTAPISPLIDNTVLEMLGAHRARYGRVRLWGAFGWGVAGTIGGIVVDWAGIHVSFYVYFIWMGACLAAAFYLPVSRSGIGHQFWQGARSLFADWQWNVLLIAAFSSSVAMSATNNFLFLYVNELGASKTLMGFSLTTATLSEILVFFFADRLLRRWGARGLLTLALLAQMVRVFAYAAMPAAWLILPINLLHGLTFSAMWAAGIAYAGEIAAPKGMAATAQGLLTGVTMGLGGIVGAVGGGLLYDTLGPVMLFYIAGSGTALGLLFFLFAGRDTSTAKTGYPIQQQE